MSTALCLLILEDDPYDAELEVATLEEAGYVCRWQRVETRAEFLACLDAPDYDLILADYNLPAFDGLTALKLFLERGLDLPFILVSGTVGEETAIESLKAGATDYVLKDRLSRLGPVVRRALHETEERRQRKRAEEALRESETRYRGIFDGVQDAIFVESTSGEILDVNARACEMYGYPRDVFLTKTMTDLVPPEHFALVPDELPELEVSDQPIEMVNIRANGEQFPVEITGQLQTIDSETVLLVVARDITERVRAEEELVRLSNAVKMSTDSIVVSDIEGKIIEVNEAALEMYGADAKGDLVGKSAFDLIAPEDREKAFAGMQEVLEKGYVKSREYHIITKNGSRVPVEMSVAIMQDAEGEPIGFVSVGRDIIERVRVEEERALLVTQIREQARQMRQTMDAVPEGVLLLDADLRVLLANPAAKGDLAVLADASVGDTLTRLGDSPLAELLTSPPKGLWHEVATDGRSFEVIARPMENGPEPEGWVLVIRDVTQEREIQQRVQQQERLAAVGQLAAGIAHDFNNIMAVIVLYARMSLRVPDLPPRVHERLETIDRQAKRATDLIQQILDFSRRAVLERRPMDLVLFLKEVVKLLERTVPEHIKIDLTYGVDEYTVNADPTRVQQVIMNLAVNARDAMPEGGELHIGLDRIRTLPPLNPPRERGGSSKGAGGGMGTANGLGHRDGHPA